jgi:hypothetical protein
MEIGKPKKVREIEPLEEPVPATVPSPAEVPATEPEPARSGVTSVVALIRVSPRLRHPEITSSESHRIIRFVHLQACR